MANDKRDITCDGKVWQAEVSSKGNRYSGAGTPVGPWLPANQDDIIFTCLSDPKEKYLGSIPTGTLDTLTETQLCNVLKGAQRQDKRPLD
jgi:hypothetical protein